MNIEDIMHRWKNQPDKYTDEQCRQALLEVNKRCKQHTLSAKRYNELKDPKHPASTTIANHLGNGKWKAAKESADF